MTNEHDANLKKLAIELASHLDTGLSLDQLHQRMDELLGGLEDQDDAVMVIEHASAIAREQAQFETLVDAVNAMVENPDLIEQIGLLARLRNDNEPKAVENRHEILADIVDVFTEAMRKSNEKQIADVSALYQLGRFILSEIDKSGEDEGLYLLINSIADRLTEHLTEFGELIWTTAATDAVLIEMSIEDDGGAPDLAPGELDRARSTMRDAGWLSWKADGDGFLYTLTPPPNWRELVMENEAAIENEAALAAAVRRAHHNFISLQSRRARQTADPIGDAIKASLRPDRKH
jgi:hypothetical protein